MLFASSLNKVQVHENVSSSYITAKTNWLFQPWSGYPGCRLAREMLVTRGLLETNCIRQPERQLPSSYYKHSTPTTLRSSVRESPACITSMGIPYCNFEVHL